MHTCANKTGGNISHLEQMVNNFLPYSQEQLGFDKPVKIVFQSDPSNADVLLGRTAHYNPEQFEVYLYTDKRHPKDVMRSLSHELVHHAQNCRGDFGSCNDTSPGYAQRDQHLRKMEREAYTKGNLIFRDFEDLIKRGKITIDINFKDSGEPQMSLKEWKDNELNTLLMKKWGLLKEGSAKERADEEGNRPSDDKKMDLDEAELEEGGWDRRGPRKKRGWGLDEEKGHEGSCDEAHAGKDHDEYMAGRDDELEESYVDVAQSRGKVHTAIPMDPDEDEDEKRKSHSSWDPSVKRHVVGSNPDLADFIMPNEPEGEPPAPGERIWDPRHLKTKTTKVAPVNVDERTSQKISVREAKEITRRIIERIRKEGK